MPDSNEKSQPAITRLEDKNCPVATLLQLDGDSRRASLMSNGRIRGGMYGWTNPEPIKPELVEAFRSLSSDKQSLLANFMGTPTYKAQAFNVVAIDGPSTRVVTPVLSGYDATSLQHTEVRLAVPPYGSESLRLRFEPADPPYPESNCGSDDFFALKPGPTAECAGRTLMEDCNFFLQAIANPDSHLVTAVFRRSKRSLTPSVVASLSWVRG